MSVYAICNLGKQVHIHTPYFQKGLNSGIDHTICCELCGQGAQQWEIVLEFVGVYDTPLEDGLLQRPRCRSIHIFTCMGTHILLQYEYPTALIAAVLLAYMCTTPSLLLWWSYFPNYSRLHHLGCWNVLVLALEQHLHSQNA